MFQNPFSFDGRIRRTEYGLSFIIYAVAAAIVNAIISTSQGDAAILGIAYIPMLWFLWAQGAKRCHDLGNNGWWQIIPLYAFWLLFQDGKPGANQYGVNPKYIQATGGQTSQGWENAGKTDDGYQGGYTGGHNTQSINYSSDGNLVKTDGYKDGDLYN